MSRWSLALIGGAAIVLVLAVYLGRPAHRSQPAPVRAIEPATNAALVEPPKARVTAPVAAPRPEDGARGWPKPGDPIVIPKGAVSSSGPSRAPAVRFDPAGCQACLSTACSEELSAGGDLDDAVHMIGCTHLVGEELCIAGVHADRLTGITIPPLPSGELTDTTRKLIACGAQCPCWTDSAAP